MSFKKETCLQKITLEPLENINAPRVFLHRNKPSYWIRHVLRTGFPPRLQTYLKHWIDDIPHDIQ